MLYKRKKPIIIVVFTYVFYLFATVFIVLGLFNLANFAYVEYNKDKVNEPTAINELPLQPMVIEDAVSNNIILQEKEKEEDIPLPKDPKVDAVMKVIADYYSNGIDRNIRPHFSASKNNMCSVVFKVSNSELVIASCDDYTFKRQVELALEKIKPYSSKVINGVDLSKEIVYFNYLTKETK